MFFSLNLCAQGYIDNIIPLSGKEIKFVNQSMIPYNVLVNDYVSKVRKWNETFTIVIPQGSTITNSLGSFGGNIMTSNVSGSIDTAKIINSNTIIWNSINGLLTSTVNGVIATATIPRVSQAFPLQNGVLDTRTGSIGTAGTNIFAAWDHQHPLIALTVPILPNCAVSGSGGSLVSQNVARVRATEESITWTIQVNTTNTAAATWLVITPPAIAGFYLSKVINAGTYDSASASLAPYWGSHPSFVWAGTAIYLRPRAVGLSLTHNIILEYTLN